MIDKTKQNSEAIYDDSIGGPFMKEMRNKFNTKKPVNIDIESIEKIIVSKEASKNNNVIAKTETTHIPNKPISANNMHKNNTFNQKPNINRNVNINTNVNRDQRVPVISSDIRPTVPNNKIANADTKEVSVFEGNKLKIIPLGGLHEIGKNLTVFEYGKDIIIVDCGVAFPTDDMLGVDLVIPDITYLEKNASRIRGMVITHGHEDHIGGIPYFLKKINVPIYATKFTIGLINTKLEEHNLLRTTKIIPVKAGEFIDLGVFKVECLKTTHSISDALAFAIHTPVGIVVHTGDFKIDYTPIDSETIDFARFADLGKKGVLLLMSDSTNVERPGYTMSERIVGLEFDKIFVNCKKRIIVTTFASNVHRMQQIINSAVKFGRKIAPVGRSMLNVITVAKELGYIDLPEGSIIDVDKIGLYNPEQLVIITTGSQGEPMAALSRMAAAEHRKVTITADDLIIFSSSPIPGNEKSIGRVIDELQKLGAEVIYNQLADVHVSGHACQEELKLMLTLTKPKYFMPIHGEYRFLKQHGKIAEVLGMKSDNIFIMSNGKTLEITNKSAKIGQQVQSGIIFVDGLGVGDVGNIVIRDRQLLSENGMIIVTFCLDSKTSKLIGGPDIVTRGFVYVREAEDLMDGIKEFVKLELEKIDKANIKEWAAIKLQIRDALCNYVYKKTKRNPMILPIITEVGRAY